jgi:hypothetical protein
VLILIGGAFHSRGRRAVMSAWSITGLRKIVTITSFYRVLYQN